MRCCLFSLAGLVALVGVSGCGGSAGAGAAGGSPSGGDLLSGSMQGYGTLNTGPLNFSASGTTVTALAGSFSQLRIRDVRPSNKETQLAFVAGSTTKIMVMDYDGANVREAYTSTVPINDLRFGRRTGRIYFIEENNKLRYIEPGSRTPVTVYDAGASQITTIDVSPGETSYAVAADPPLGNTNPLFVAALPGFTGSFGGTSADTPYTTVRLLDDEGKVLFTRNEQFGYYNASQSFISDFVSSIPGGGFMAIDPQGNTAAILGRNATRTLRLFSISKSPSFFGGLAFAPNSTLDFGLPEAFSGFDWDVEGKSLLYNANRASINTINTSGIGSVLQPLTSQYGPLFSFAQSHPLATRNLVGGSASFGAAGAGVIMLEQGPALRSFLVWDAAVRSTSRVIREEENTANIVLRIEADRITRMANTVDNGFVLSQALPAGLSVNGALASFDSATGALASILFYNQARSARPTVASRGRAIVVEGEAELLVDGKGNKLAGAGPIRFTVQDGRVVLGS